MSWLSPLFLSLLAAGGLLAARADAGPASTIPRARGVTTEQPPAFWRDGKAESTTSVVVVDISVRSATDVMPAGTEAPLFLLGHGVCEKARASARSAAVELEDDAGNSSSISLKAIDSISGITTAVFAPGIETTSAAFKTFRIPIAGFAADGRSINLTRVTKVRFKFGSPESAAGRIALDDVEVVP